MLPSLEQLKNTQKYLENISIIEYVNQYARKILINSLYGAVGNNHFRFYDLRNAEAVTATGQLVIQWGGNKINDRMNSLLKDNNNYIIYQDTDSVIGSTIIRTSEGNFRIDDLYNKLNGNVEIRGEDNFIKHIDNIIFTPSVNTNLKIENKQIKYIMKHKVKKKMYKICINSKEVIVTEDHSVMVYRNNELISVKPYEILKTDEILFMNN